MVKKLLLIILAVVLLISFSCLLRHFVYQKNGINNDFTIKVSGNSYNVIVGKPDENLDELPLVIYHHGEGYRTLEPFELRNLSKIFAKEGLLFWAPERTPRSPERALETLKEARAVDKAILDLVIQHPEVNKSNINVVGFCLGSWVAFENDATSPNVRTVSLLGFGAPFDDTLLYDYVTDLANNTDYSKISARILVMVSREDSRVDIEVGEIVRKKMIQANKSIDAIEYTTGDHLSLAGNKTYLMDLIKYLKGEKINTSDFIKVDEALKKKWERIWKTGYW